MQSVGLISPPSTRPNSRPRFEVFGNYILLTELASGGMAEVFLARPLAAQGNGRVLVIKRILPHIATNPTFVNMFQGEIQTIMAFNHPNTVQLHDFGEINQQPYIAMEYIDGKNLREVITQFQKKKESIPIPMAISLLAQAAAGLGYAHSFRNAVTGEVVNAIHRDVSPHNLIVSYDGNLKVIDFGIAKAKSGMAEQTATGTIKGKVGYLSPEQIQGQPLDSRVDIFSLAVVAWELLTLKRPFVLEGDSDMTVMKRIEACEELSPPSAFNRTVPPELDALLMKALKRDPAQRPANAAVFQEELRNVLRRHYPTYSYSETGQLMRALFEDEIKAERERIHELNRLAQEVVAHGQSSESLEATRLTGGNGPGAWGVLENLRLALPVLSVPMEARLAELEKMAKQKATIRHYVMFSFYLFALFGLQLNEHYSWADRFLLPAQARISARASAPAVAPAPEPAHVDLIPKVTETRVSVAVSAPAVERSPASVPKHVRRSRRHHHKH